MSSEKTAQPDPLEVAREEYRKLLKRVKAAEAEVLHLRGVLASAAALVNGDQHPEELTAHPIIPLLADATMHTAWVMHKNDRLAALLRGVIIQSSGSGPRGPDWEALLAKIRTEVTAREPTPERV